MIILRRFVPQPMAIQRTFNLLLCLTVQPRFKDPLFNQVLDMANDVLQPRQIKLQ